MEVRAPGLAKLERSGKAPSPGTGILVEPKPGKRRWPWARGHLSPPQFKHSFWLPHSSAQVCGRL